MVGKFGIFGMAMNDEPIEKGGGSETDPPGSKTGKEPEFPTPSPPWAPPPGSPKKNDT